MVPSEARYGWMENAGGLGGAGEVPAVIGAASRRALAIIPESCLSNSGVTSDMVNSVGAQLEN